MNDQFIILSKKNSLSLSKEFSDFTHVYQGEKLTVFATRNIREINKIRILIDGFVVPRNEIFESYKHLTQHQLVYKLYKEYDKGFVNYIKGFFIVVIINVEEILIVNDLHSVKRIYFFKNEETLIVTNELQFLSRNVNLVINPHAPAVMAAFQHLVEGITLFKDVYYSLPATIIEINRNDFKINKYLDTDYFVNLKRQDTILSDFHAKFLTTIKNYIEYLNPKTISSTLTGGRDTRSILAALLKLGISPHCFTFGYPTGIDVLTSIKIAKQCDLKFSNHYIDNLSLNTYNTLVEEIVRWQNPFIHIHRAHRLDAIKKESDCHNGSLDMVFVGAMGGDYIMGEHFNDYILTEFLRKYLTGKEAEKDVFNQIFNKHFIKEKDENIEFVRSVLDSLGLQFKVFNKEVEFNLVHKIIGSTHDIQDINVFLKYSDYVIAPFMDIDVMEALFSSNLSLFSNTRHTVNPFKRLKGGELQCSMIKKYAPELTSIPFANQYTPDDVLGNWFVYVLKRIYLQMTKEKSKPTFTYDEWFSLFMNYKVLQLSEEMASFYDLVKLKEAFSINNHQSHEGYWHKYTNPIMIDLYLKQNKGLLL